MSVYIGEAIVLYGVAVLNIYAFAYDGWICGRLCSQHCFDSNGMVVVLSCLAIALSLSIIAAIVQIVAACIDSDSSASWGLNVSLKVLTCIVAISDVVAICYYYSQLTKPLWNEIAAGVCAGLASAIAITKLTYGYHSCN
ncbi:hypothetical protein TSMEX_003558 [Taenia solium]|eukprot:TsM_000174800 transcript=TsM_000174800 gene=TsM_000174800